MARILHLISQLEEGGAQRQLSYVVSRINAHEVEIASLIASPPHKLLPAFQEIKTPIHFLSETNDFYAPDIVHSLKQLLMQKRYDLVHCWLFESIVQGVIVARLAGIPVIASPRSMRIMLDLNHHRRWEQRLVRKTLALSDIVLFPSHTAAIDFVDAGWVDSTRARVVQNGVDVEHFYPAEGGNAVVNIGRISGEKGHDELRTIYQRLREIIPDARLLIAGGGTPPSWEGVEFCGFVADIRKVFRQSYVYISTSRVEGMSNALLEAQSMGIPAVVRNDGFNSEIIEHGLNGYLTNTIEDFVECCTRLWQEPDLRSTMGIEARKKAVDHFNISEQVRKIEAVYDELL